MQSEQQYLGLTADILGDPFELKCNRHYLDIITNKFRAQARYDGIPITVEMKQSYWLWTTDKRTVRVRNMPAGFDDLTRASTAVVRILRRAIIRMTRSIDSSNVGRLANIFIVGPLLNSPELALLCRLGFGCSPEELASSLCALIVGMIEAGWRLVVAGVELLALTLFAPIGALISVCVTYGTLKEQKLKNYVRLIWELWQLLSGDIDRIMQSNVLITAIDERNLWPMPWNRLRSNDGVWCDVRFMDLPAARRLCDYQGDVARQQLLEFQNEFRQLDEAFRAMISTLQSRSCSNPR